MYKKCDVNELSDIFIRNVQICDASAFYIMYTALIYDLVTNYDDPDERILRIDNMAQNFAEHLCSELFTRLDVIASNDSIARIVHLVLMIIPNVYFGYNVTYTIDAKDNITFKYSDDKFDELVALPAECEIYRLITAINKIIVHSLRYFDIYATITTISSNEFFLQLEEVSIFRSKNLESIKQIPCIMQLIMIVKI